MVSTGVVGTSYLMSMGIYGFVILAIVGLLVGSIVLWKISEYMGNRRPIALALFVAILAVAFVWVFNWLPYIGWILGPIFVWITVKIAYDMGWIKSFITVLIVYLATLIVLAPLYMLMFVMYESLFNNTYYTIGAGITIILILCAIFWFFATNYKSGSIGREGRGVGRKYTQSKSYR